jgi:hypothetical protein
MLPAPSGRAGYFRLGSSHIWILEFGFDGGKENVTKCYHNLSPGLILGALCRLFRAGPVWRGHGAQFDPKKSENQTKLKSTF